MSNIGPIPSVVFPIDKASIRENLDALRAHAAKLREESDTTNRLIHTLQNECKHVNASTWSTGDGDGSQGFQCSDCGTVGER